MFKLNPYWYTEYHIWYISKQLASYENWFSNDQKSFTLQRNFLRLSVFDLQTDDLNQFFQTVNKNRVHHETYK